MANEVRKMLNGSFGKHWSTHLYSSLNPVKHEHLSKKYLKVQFLPQRKHNASPLQTSTEWRSLGK
jgi:hypothetical protein